MKTPPFTLTIFLILFLNTSIAFPQTSDSLYTIKSGIIHFHNFENNVLKSKSTTYFDQFGMREATEFIVIRDGEDYIRNVIVRDHTIQYVYGLSDKTASKQDLRKSYYYNSNPLLLKIEGDKNRFEKIGTEILGGKTCELLQNKDESFKEQICVWNNIVIKTVWEDSSFNFSIIAVSIDENVTIDESKFRVPDDYEIYDHEKTMEEFKKK